MLKIMSGSVTARIVGLALMPLLTRIYAPEDFGTLSVYTAFVLLFQPLLSMRFVMAIPLPRRDATAINILALSLLVAAVLYLCLSAALLFAPSQVLALTEAELLRPYVWLILLSLPFIVFSEAMSAWATRKRRYGAMAKSEIGSRGISDVSKVLLGLLGVKPFGLLLGQAMVQIALSLGFLCVTSAPMGQLRAI
ncbi:Polysaccharide biosynthesis protein [Celeribacter indicus]|uniref:Polysaccharide biosynthesis protein n=2 Tax=Celeribacter indicus TaxID=1208324 RepID=A0A0B5E5V9_9RHOB|nr:polysaccharide biosynthesis protein [Celeribacter indicus]SDX10746.1 Polysaccharide biosynthesis protein [Celeribacter indicus]